MERYGEAVVKTGGLNDRECDMRSKLVSYFSRSPLSSLVLMTAFFLGFGYFSLNLFFLFKANIELVAAHGVMALKDGAAVQLVLIAAAGFASSVCYSGIKLCERFVVGWATRE